MEEKHYEPRSAGGPTNQSEKSNPAPRAAWRIHEWAAAVGICRATVYNMARRGEIELVQLGRVSLVRPGPTEFLDRKASENRRCVK